MIKWKWFKDKKLVEQIKFFGGTQKKFISVYAKQVKPRIKIKLKGLGKPASQLDYLQNNALLQQNLAMQDLAARGQASSFLGSYLSGYAGQASALAAQRQCKAMSSANELTRQMAFGGATIGLSLFGRDL